MKYLLLFLTTACISDVPQVKRISITKKNSRYCLRGSAIYHGKVEPVELCTDTKPACDRALYLAKTYGSLAGLKQVDTCVKDI